MINKEVKLSNNQKPSLVEINNAYTVQVIKILGTNKISDLLISFFLKLVSMVEYNEENLRIQIDCLTFFLYIKKIS